MDTFHRETGVGRRGLVTSLAAFADSRRRDQSLRFLEGLSADELLYIADFLGACVLEAWSQPAGGREELAERITRFQQCRALAPSPPACDQDHKMILLLEYFCRSGLHG